jgi:hypothetical protein
MSGMPRLLTRSRGGYRAVQIGPLFVTTAHPRRWLLLSMQKVDRSYNKDWTLRWAERRGWISSREQGRWYLK